MEIRPYIESDEPEVIDLWRACNLLRPINDPRKDIARKLRLQRDLFLVGVEDGRVVASLMAGYEGHRGWIYYVAVEPAEQGRGLGRAIMEEAERRLRDLGCPKINLMVRRDNLEVVKFYLGLGYTENDAISLGKRLESDEPPAREPDRT